jgi:hypothetical protein
MGCPLRLSLAKSGGYSICEADSIWPTGFNKQVDAINQQLSEPIIAENVFVICERLADEPNHHIGPQRFELKSLTTAIDFHHFREKPETYRRITRK